MFCYGIFFSRLCSPQFFFFLLPYFNLHFSYTQIWWKVNKNKHTLFPWLLFKIKPKSVSFKLAFIVCCYIMHIYTIMLVFFISSLSILRFKKICLYIMCMLKYGVMSILFDINILKVDSCLLSEKDPFDPFGLTKSNSVQSPAAVWFLTVHFALYSFKVHKSFEKFCSFFMILHNYLYYYKVIYYKVILFITLLTK